MLLTILQIVVAVVLIVFIMLQAKGGGLSPAFGGGGEMYRSKQSLEKFLIIGTIVFSVLLGLLSLLLLIY